MWIHKYKHTYILSRIHRIFVSPDLLELSKAFHAEPVH